MEKFEPFPVWTVEAYIAAFSVWFSADSLFFWNGLRHLIMLLLHLNQSLFDSIMHQFNSIVEI
jgi:hypothetical protein